MTQINDVRCPFCGNEDLTMIETNKKERNQLNCFCQICSKTWTEKSITVMDRSSIISGRRMAS